MEIRPQEQRLKIQDATVYLLGGGHGEPILLLHGFAGPWGWLTFHDLLAQRAHLIVPDHPGFGRSELPSWLESIHDLAFFYQCFQDALEWDRVTVVGFSLGGWVAAELAALCPHRIKRLILVDPLGLRVDSASIPDIYFTGPEAVRELAVYQSQASKEVDVLYPNSMSSEEEGAVRERNERTAAMLTWRPYMHSPTLPVRLRRLANLPTLLVWGRHDRIVTLDHAAAYQKAIPGSHLVVLEKCGHSPEVEQPLVLAKAIQEFAQG